MFNLKIELAFDEKKQATRAIRTEISQRSSISLILFSLYIRFLFLEIKNEVKYANLKMPSFIDNVAIGVEPKSAKQNTKLLTEIVQKIFLWVDRNAVKFDDEKTKLIHLESSNSWSNDTIKLSNNTILKSKINVKWLGIYMDRILNFKKHVQNRIALTNRVLHSINWLQNLKWGLKSNARSQIYQTYITSISDYGAEILYNAQNPQKSYTNKLQKL